MLLIKTGLFHVFVASRMVEIDQPPPSKFFCSTSKMITVKHPFYQLYVSVKISTYHPLTVIWTQNNVGYPWLDHRILALGTLLRCRQVCSNLSNHHFICSSTTIIVSWWYIWWWWFWWWDWIPNTSAKSQSKNVDTKCANVKLQSISLRLSGVKWILIDLPPT